MSLFALVLVVFALALLAGALGRERHPGAPVSAVAVAAPSLLLMTLVTLLIGGAVLERRFDGLRIVLEGLSVDLRTLKDRPLTVGGDKASDAVVVDGLPARALRIGLDADGRPVATLAPARAGEPSGLVKIDGAAAGSDPIPLDAAGRSTKLSLYRAEPSVSGGAARLVEKRSLDLVVRDGRLGVLFDTPSVERIGGDRLARALDLRRQAGLHTVTLAFSGAAAGTGAHGPSSLPFPIIGEQARAQLFGRIELSGSRRGFTVIDAHGGAPVGFGQTFQVGGDLAALARIDRVDLGWSAYRHLAWLPVAALLLSLVGTWALRRRSMAAFLILSLIDLLLVLRLTVAAEAAYVSDALRVTQAVRDTLFALIAVPFFAAALDDPEVDRRTRIGHGAAVLVALAAMALASGLSSGEHAFARAPGFDDVLGPVGLLCLVLTLAGLARLTAPQALWEQIRSRLPEVSLSSSAAREALAKARAWVLDRDNVWAPIALLAGLSGVRIALLLVDIREAVHLPGVRIPLSVLYTPLSLGLFAWALLRLSRGGEAPGRVRAWLAAPAVWAAWAVALLVAPAFIHDSGYFVTNAAPFLLWAALASLTAAGLSRIERAWLAAPGALALAGYLALSLNAAFTAPKPDLIARAAEAPTSPEARQLLARYAADVGNRLRLEAVFDPAALSSRGSAGAERDRNVIAHRAVYADSFTGRGWLSLERPTLLEKTQLDDDLGEIHILSPFGRVGGAALLGIEGLIAVLVTLAVLRRHGADLLKAPVATSLGLLALWTVFCVSAYMFLGVVQVLPFTGRDIYLLAAASPSDLVEGLLLLGLSYALIRREEDAWAG